MGLCSDVRALSLGNDGGGDFGAAMTARGVTACDQEGTGSLWHDRPWQQGPVQQCSDTEQKPTAEASGFSDC